MPAGGVSIGSVSVRVLPNTANFVPSLQKYLTRIERTLRIQVRVEADTTRLSEQVHATTERLSGQRITAPLDADTTKAAKAVDTWRARISRNAATIKVAVDRANLQEITAAGAKVTRSLAGIGARTLVFAALAAGAGVAATAVDGLVVSLATMLPAAALIPAVLGATAAVAATAAVGLRNVGDALKTALDPSKAKEFNAAMAKLAPNAQAFVRSIQGLKPAFDGLRLDVQQRLFAGVGAEVNRLGTTYLPVLRTGMGEIADRLSGVTRGVVTMLASAHSVSDISTLFSNASASVTPLGAALIAVLAAVRTIAAEASKWLPGFAAGIATAATNFQTFIANARQSGQLTAWIQAAIDTIRTFGQLLVNVGSIVFTVFAAASNSGTNFLAVLNQAAGAAAGFLRSAQGSHILIQIFGGLSAAAAGLAPVLMAIGQTIATFIAPAIAALGPQIGAAFAALAPAIRPLGQIIAALGPVVGALANLFATTLTAAIEKLAPVIVALSGPLTALLNRLAGSPGVVAGFAAGFLVLAKLVPLIGPIAQLVTSLGGMDAILETVGRAFTFLTGPIGLAIGLFTALMATSAPFRQAIFSIVGVIGQLVGQIGSALAPVLQTLVAAVAPLIAQLGAALAPILRLIASLIGALIPVITPVIQLLAAILTPVIQAVAFVLRGLIALLQGIVSGNLFTALGSMISSAFTGLLSAAGSFLSTLGRAIATGASTAWHGLVSALQTAITAVGQFLLDLPNTVAYALGFLAGLVVRGAMAAWDFLWNTMPTAIDQALTWLQGLPARALAALALLGTQLVTFATNAWHSFVNAGITAAVGIITWAQALPGRVLGFLASLPGRLSRAASDAFHSFVNAGITAGIGIITWVQSLPGRVGQFFADAGNWLYNAGRNIIQGLVNGITGALGWVWDKIKSIGHSIVSGFQDALGIHSPSTVAADKIGRWIPAGIAAGVDKYAPEVTAAMNRVGALVTGAQISADASVTTSVAAGGSLLGAIAEATRQGASQAQPQVLLDGRKVNSGLRRAGRVEASR